MQFKKLMLTLGVALLMAGCGSSVKLDDIPVEDRAGAAVTGQGDDAAKSGAATSAVSPVDLDRSKLAAGPAGVGKVIYFDYDSFAIRPESQPIVEAHARHLKADRNRKANLEGHTDERGGREYNLALGQKRSEAVRRALTLLGVPDSQLEAVSYGKEKPAVQGSDEAAWAQNRRVELTYR